MIYMITEDYVSFETAKLLKEKGFNEIKCNTCYKWNGNFCNNRRSMSGIDNEICYQAPTLQMAMKWLRKAHKWHIEISRGEYGYFAYIMSTKNLSAENYSVQLEGRYDLSYEEACEAAIKYCLENLI